MISRFVRIQLVIFTVLSVLSLSVITLVYGRVPELLGIGQYEVTVRLPDAAGLYDGSRVSYRGVDVGRVTEITADERGAVVKLTMDADHRIPADSVAEVHSVSAIGEQYIDFVADGDGTQYLADGAVVTEERTKTPTSIAAVLENANRLVATLPRDSLKTSLNELAEAFNGTGPSLNHLMEESFQLVDSAQQHLGPTKELIRDAYPLLSTQTATSAEIRSLLKSLRSFTDQVVASDGDLRRMIDHTAPAAAQVDRLFQDLRPTVPILLSNLINVEQTLVTYNAALEQVLVVYPRVTTALIGANIPDNDGMMGLDFRATVQDPQPCTVGYASPDQFQDPTSMKIVPTPRDLYCKLPQDHPSTVRGVRNLPCLEVPGKRAPTPAACRGEFRPQRDEQPVFPEGSFLDKATGALGKVVGLARYDARSGKGITADGHFFAIGGTGSSTAGKEDLTWQRMLVGPLGR